MKSLTLTALLLTLTLTGFGCVFTAEGPVETGVPEAMPATIDDGADLGLEEGQPPYFKPVEADELVGGWLTVLGPDFEEIDFNEDGTFSTFLHERPFQQGYWEMTDGEGLLLEVDGYYSVWFSDVVFEEGMLIFDQMVDGEEYWVFEPIE